MGTEPFGMREQSVRPSILDDVGEIVIAVAYRVGVRAQTDRVDLDHAYWERQSCIRRACLALPLRHWAPREISFRALAILRFYHSVRQEPRGSDPVRGLSMFATIPEKFRHVAQAALSANRAKRRRAGRTRRGREVQFLFRHLCSRPTLSARSGRKSDEKVT
jgi:hypothetical protein